MWDTVWRGENLTVLRGEAIMPRKKSQDAFSESARWLSCQKRGFSGGSEVPLSKAESWVLRIEKWPGS